MQLNKDLNLLGRSSRVGVVKPNLKGIPNKYQQYAEVFSKSKSKQLPSHWSYNLFI